MSGQRRRQLIAAGITAGEDGRHEEAYGFFSQARALDNESGEAHGLLGQALLALGKPADALDHFYKAFAIDVPLAVLRRDLVRAHFNVGAESFNSGDYGRAAASYRLVCELQPNDVQARRDLATALAQSDRLEQALVVAAELVRDHPDDPEALLDVARVLTSAGQLELAQEMSERAAELAVPRTPE